MIAALTTVVLVLGVPPKGAEKPAKAGDKDAEIARLQGEIIRLGRDRAKLKKELKASKQAIAELRDENQKLSRAADPEALSYLSERAAGMLLELFKELDSVISKAGVPRDEADAILSAVLMAINQWQDGDRDRRAIATPTAQWLSSRAEALADRVEGRTRRVAEEFRTNAASLKQAFDGADRVTAAKIIGSVEGMRIAWRGTILRMHQRNPVMGHDVELSCGGTIARVTLSDPSQLSRLGTGQDVKIEGTIAAVDYYPFLGIEVDVVTAQISGR